MYKKIINHFKTKKVLVVGDIMLDRYVRGSVIKISPEAPVPVIRETQRTYKLGGAGNTADNLVCLGAKVFLCGVIGNDPEAQTILQLCAEKSINTSYVTRDKNTPTILKTRFVTGNSQLLRLDRERKTPSPNIPQKNVDAIIISDYNKGSITTGVMQKIRQQYPNTPVIIDPHSGRNTEESVELYRNCTLLKPNLKDAKHLADWKYEEDLNTIMQVLKKRYKTDILLTMGSKGMAVLHKGMVKHIPTQAREIYDVSGAGDTVTAVATLSLISGANLYETAVLSNKAAGVVVQKPGTATLNTDELLETINENTKVKAHKELLQITQQLKQQGKTIVFTNGCFDILHKLHYHLLRDSKKLGDTLIVALNTDESIKQLKGLNRPFVNERDRAELLSAFECVDYITFFKSETPIDLIKKLKPNIITKGGDYTPCTVCGHKSVTRHGGKVVIIPYDKEYSTTKLVREIERRTSQKTTKKYSAKP